MPLATDDPKPFKLHRLRTLHLFAGAGGGILADILLGHQTVCAVEIDPYCQQILSNRQKDGHLPWFPIFGDVRQFDGKPWKGLIDCVSGGFPCQDISSAGKGAGITGEKSGLWKEFARVIGETCPPFVFIENSPNLRTRGLVTVLQDLAYLGYDAKWGVLGAQDVGAPHIRKRMWIVAYSRGLRCETNGMEPNTMGEKQPNITCHDLCSTTPTNSNNGGQRKCPIDAQMEVPQEPTRIIKQNTPDSNSEPIRQQSGRSCREDGKEEALARVNDWWPVDIIQGVDDGVSNRMDRVRATGNAQVPGVAELAWRILNNLK